MRRNLVVPVRLSHGGRVVQTTTRSVTTAEVLIRCVAPPLPGTYVELRLYLPDGGPEDLRGTVADAPQDDGPSCRVELTGLTEEQRQRLERAVAPPVLARTPLTGAGPVVPGRPLSSRPTPAQLPVLSHPTPTMTPVAVKRVAAPSAGDQRALTRVPVRLKVSFETVEELADQLAVNLSSGMFVRCNPPPALGAEVVLSIALPGSWPPLLCRAVVTHRVVPEQARTTGQITGAGVQFLDADDRFRAEIDRYVALVQGLTPL